MRARDVIHFSAGALEENRLRTFLMVVAMATGVGAVVMLTSLGEGARLYVVDRFASLGTDLLFVVPGRAETAGLAPQTFVGETPRDLTLGDAASLMHHPAVAALAPIVVGEALASTRGRAREVPVIGSTAEFLSIRRWELSRGRFLPPGNPTRPRPVCVIGTKVEKELFGARPALGAFLRVGDRRCRVIGILGSRGRSIGVDVEELVIVPVALAQELFNTSGLFRIVVEARNRESVPKVKEFILETIKKRHQGELDVTVITQDAVISTFDRIFHALTLAVAGIAALSLLVAGILTMNIMLIAVARRRAEVGILRALGATRLQVMVLFLAEAAMMSLGGGLLGLVAGKAGALAIGEFYREVSFKTPGWAPLAAISVAVATGLLFGALPAKRAAGLDPVEALSRR